MSIVSMLAAARAVFAERRDRFRVYDELNALDDHSLEDIGLHRSQLPGMVERLFERDAAPVTAQTSPRWAESGTSVAQQRLRRA
jgi:uncharacterized protein YjiS (DUF1127 family)